jgi:hypothetical protein
VVTLDIQRSVEIDVLIVIPSDPADNGSADQLTPDYSGDTQPDAGQGDSGNTSGDAGGMQGWDQGDWNEVCPNTDCADSWGAAPPYVPGGGLAFGSP